MVTSIDKCIYHFASFKSPVVMNILIHHHYSALKSIEQIYKEFFVEHITYFQIYGKSINPTIEAQG